MARGPQVAIVGAKKLRKELKAAGFKMSDLKEPHLAAARVVSHYAQPRSPKRTGALAKTLKPKGTMTMGTIRAGSSKVQYANPIHWGWAPRPVHPWGNINAIVDAPIKAQPWVSDAAQKTEPTWLQLFIDHMNEAISEVDGAKKG